MNRKKSFEVKESYDERQSLERKDHLASTHDALQFQHSLSQTKKQKYISLQICKQNQKETMGEGFEFGEKSLPNGKPAKNSRNKAKLIEKNFLKYEKKMSSPKKCLPKYEIGQSLIALRAKYRNNFPSSLNQSNFFKRNNKHYYTDTITLQLLLEKIYYEGYQLEDLQEFFQPIFNKMQTYKEFFKDYLVVVEGFGKSLGIQLVTDINKLLKSIYGRLQGNQDFEFKRSICSIQYKKFVNRLYDYYKYLNTVNCEAEKILRIYIKDQSKHQIKSEIEKFQFQRWKILI